MGAERGISAVSSTTVLVIITVLLAVLTVTALLSYTDVLEDETRVEGAVSYSTADGGVQVRVVSLQAADHIYVRPVDDSTSLSWSGTTSTEHGELVVGDDNECDVADTATASNVPAGTTLLVIAENDGEQRVVQMIEVGS